MTSKERVIAAITGKSLDRRPVSLLLSLYGARLTGCPLSVYYRDAAEYARGQSAVRTTFSPDILCGPFALALEGAAFGSRVSFYIDQAPNISGPVLENAGDFSGLTVPDCETQPELVFFREALARMVSEHGSDVPVAAIALNPVDLPVMLMGIGAWMETVLFDEPVARRILEITIPYFVDRINDLFSLGADFVVMPSAFVNPDLVTRSVIEEMALPALRAAFGEVNGRLVMHSGGARMAPFLDLFTSLPNVAGFVVNCDEDMNLARRKAGPKKVLIGNIDGPNLHSVDPGTIQAGSEYLLRDRTGDPHFILGTSAADIAYSTPPDHIHAVGRAVRAFAGA